MCSYSVSAIILTFCLLDIILNNHIFVEAKSKKKKTILPELTINNCRGIQFDFDEDSDSDSDSALKSKYKYKSSWPIHVNDHCGQKLVGYTVELHTDIDIDIPHSLLTQCSGLYEPYGLSDGVVRYEYVLNNGTTFQLKRFSKNNMCYWLLTRGHNALAYTGCDTGLDINRDGGSDSNSDTPPVDGIWEEIRHNSLPSVPSAHPNRKNNRKNKGKGKGIVTLTKHQYKRKKRRVTHLDLDSMVSSSGGSSSGNNKDEKMLNSMLHPAIGRAFGKQLYGEYHAAEPYPGIAIDYAINNKKLLKALDFLNTPINTGKYGWNSVDNSRNMELDGDMSDWVGPEEVVYCCKQKYRLDFQHWRGSKYSRALQSITANPQFIGFLEEMTGIPGLIPMKVYDERILWAGSTIIGVKPGGYLLVHNDVSGCVAGV